MLMVAQHTESEGWGEKHVMLYGSVVEALEQQGDLEEGIERE